MTRRHCLTLDLKNDPALIAAYKQHHAAVWPGVIESLRASGILKAELYLRGTRLVMILDVSAEFSFENKASRDLADPIVQDWERLMWTFQQALPDARAGEKWQPMKRIFAVRFPSGGYGSRIDVRRNPRFPFWRNGNSGFRRTSIQDLTHTPYSDIPSMNRVRPACA